MRKFICKFKKLGQRGLSLYLAIIILATLMALTFGLSTILISQIKIVRGMGYSVAALYAADTGVEKILYDASQNIDIITACPESSPCTGNLENNASFSVFVIAPGLDCPADTYCIRSTGLYQGIRRAIQVNR